MKFILKLLLAFTFLMPFVSCQNNDALEEYPINLELEKDQDTPTRNYSWLSNQESYGGHTIARHVNKSESYLDGRIASGLPNASTFIFGNPRYSTLGTNNDLGIILRNVQIANPSLRRMRRGDPNIVIDVNNSSGAVGFVRDRSGRNHVTSKFKTVWKYHHLYGSFLLTAYPVR